MGHDVIGYKPSLLDLYCMGAVQVLGAEVDKIVREPRGQGI